MHPLRVSSVQFEHAPGDKEANLARIRYFVAAARKQNVQLIAFPECYITGYFFLRRLTRAACSRNSKGACKSHVISISGRAKQHRRACH
jgi:predicted amidohydrolase